MQAWLNQTSAVQFYEEGQQAAENFIMNCSVFHYPVNCLPALVRSNYWHDGCYTISQEKITEAIGEQITTGRTGHDFGFSFNVNVDLEEYSMWAQSMGAGLMVSGGAKYGSRILCKCLDSLILLT